MVTLYALSIMARYMPGAWRRIEARNRWTRGRTQRIIVTVRRRVRERTRTSRHEQEPHTGLHRRARVLGAPRAGARPRDRRGRGRSLPRGDARAHRPVRQRPLLILQRLGTASARPRPGPPARSGQRDAGAAAGGAAAGRRRAGAAGGLAPGRRLAGQPATPARDRRRPRGRVARSHRAAAAPVSTGPARIGTRCPRRGGVRRPADRGRGPLRPGGARSANERCGVPSGSGGQARRIQAEPVRGGGAVHGDRQRGDRRRGVQATDVRGDESGSGARPRSRPAPRHRELPLGSWLGGLWYGVFPAMPSLLATIGAMAGLALAFSVLSAFAGVVADPVQRRIGRHRRLLERLVAALGHSLHGGDPGRFAVRDHWIARLLDVVDLLRTAWSKLH